MVTSLPVCHAPSDQNHLGSKSGKPQNPQKLQTVADRRVLYNIEDTKNYALCRLVRFHDWKSANKLKTVRIGRGVSEERY
jgi:hypothetical protein